MFPSHRERYSNHEIAVHGAMFYCLQHLPGNQHVIDCPTNDALIKVVHDQFIRSDFTDSVFCRFNVLNLISDLSGTPVNKEALAK